MFYTRGCRHTTMLFNPDRPDSFRHGNPPRLPNHFFSKTQFGDEAASKAVELLSAPVAPIVHFIWCNKQHFQFQNYLSVLSAYKMLKPTAIHFHYTDLPEMDSDGYYQFFMDLRRDLPNLVLEPVGSSSACSDMVNDKFSFVTQLLNKDGGMFIRENVVLGESLLNYRKKKFSIASTASSLDVVMMEKGFMDSVKPALDFSQFLKEQEAARFFCLRHVSYEKSPEFPCVFVFQQIFPSDTWELYSDFGKLARWLARGSMEILKPQQANHTVIPNIVHYVWLGSNNFKYFSYLSLLSALYVLNADMVYIHGDVQPHGVYWDKMKRHKRVTFVLRDFPGAIFAEPIVKFASHASDYWRGDLLIRYGGIYMDWDVIWVNPIPTEMRRYDTVACADFVPTGAFPDVFNMGVLLAAQGSQFLRYFLESYHHYLDNHWSYNAIHMPYKVYEKHPDLLHVDRHLQVICAMGLCHPVWNPDFKKPRSPTLANSPFDWRTDTLAMHWTHPDPVEFASEESLEDSITMFAAIGKYVLRKAEKELEKELV
ncbi:hypothetical protein V1264_022948 [Littorina saxatilis]|uniref:Alpha 1,4-glycosyltransferase domain-containing protein n=2 Tax=Littorina saxatilis TaxID=31220 RepID=A0AAN9B5Y2_9CAEN